MQNVGGVPFRNPEVGKVAPDLPAKVVKKGAEMDRQQAWDPDSPLAGQRAQTIESVVGAVPADLGSGKAPGLQPREILGEGALLVGALSCASINGADGSSDGATCLSCLLEEIESQTGAVGAITAQTRLFDSQDSEYQLLGAGFRKFPFLD